MSSSVPPRIGSFDNSVGFDFVRFEKHVKGKSEHLQRSDFSLPDANDEEDSVVVRCERTSYKFFLNGKELFSCPEFSGGYSPAFRGVGDWTILKVTFGYS